MASDGDRDIAAPAFNIITHRIPMYTTQGGTLDASTADAFIKATFGQLIEVTTNSWGTDFIASDSSGDFDVIVRTYWANRRFNDPK